MLNRLVFSIHCSRVASYIYLRERENTLWIACWAGLYKTNSMQFRSKVWLH